MDHAARTKADIALFAEVLLKEIAAEDAELAAAAAAAAAAK